MTVRMQLTKSVTDDVPSSPPPGSPVLVPSTQKNELLYGTQMHSEHETPTIDAIRLLIANATDDTEFQRQLHEQLGAIGKTQPAKWKQSCGASFNHDALALVDGELWGALQSGELVKVNTATGEIDVTIDMEGAFLWTLHYSAEEGHLYAGTKTGHLVTVDHASRKVLRRTFIAGDNIIYIVCVELT